MKTAKEVARQVWRIADSDDGSILDIEQALRAYAESIREAAASRCIERGDDSDSQDYTDGCRDCADAIRSIEIK